MADTDRVDTVGTAGTVFVAPGRAPSPFAGFTVAERAGWSERFFDDAASEYDARFLSAKIRRGLASLSEPFRRFFDAWDADEIRHYEGFASLYADCGRPGEDPAVRRSALEKAMAARVPDFSAVDRFLTGEFPVCVLLAYDELMNTLAYSGEFKLYDSLSSPDISVWIRRVARDEARHYFGAMALLRNEHRGRLDEVEALLGELVAIDTSGEPYAATFVLDRGDDMLNAARDQAEASAARVMRRLRRPA